MVRTDTSFADLSDEQLLSAVQRLAATERRATAALIESLMELDARRLYLGAGCSSLFTYCTQVLHLAEGAAYNRIEAARAARRFPPIIEALADGSLTLTAVRLLAPHLTADNHLGVLASARHMRKADIERLVASLHPKADVPAVIRKLPEPRRAAPDARTTTPVMPVAQIPIVGTQAATAPSSPRPNVTALAPDRYKVQLTISRETHEKLRRVQALARHTIPSGDPAEIFDRALTLLLRELERRRCAETSSPRSSRTASEGSRYIPAAVKREVWRRDEGQCAFVGTAGRCRERGFLEFHHVQPYAAGGAATAANLQLRCRPHNGYEASLFFGGEAPIRVREARLEYGDAAPASIGNSAAEAIRSFGERPMLAGNYVAAMSVRDSWIPVRVTSRRWGAASLPTCSSTWRLATRQSSGPIRLEAPAPGPHALPDLPGPNRRESPMRPALRRRGRTAWVHSD